MFPAFYLRTYSMCFDTQLMRRQSLHGVGTILGTVYPISDAYFHQRAGNIFDYIPCARELVR